MNALKLLAICAAGERTQLAKALAMEWLHALLAAAPNGLLVWLAWQLLVDGKLDGHIWLWLALLAGLFVVQLLIAPGIVKRTNQLSYHLSCRLRHQLAEHSRRLSLGVFGSQRLGNFADQLNSSINRFEFALSHSLTNILAALSIPPMLLVLLAWLDWRLGLMLACSLLIASLVHYLLGQWLAGCERRARCAEQDFRAALLNQLAALPMIKSYGGRGYWRTIHQQGASQADQALRKVELFAQPLEQLSALLLDLAFVGILWFGFHLAADGQLALPALLLFALIGYRAFGPIKVLLGDWLLLRQLDDQLARACHLFATRPLPLLATTTQMHGLELVCRNLHFGYNKQAVLRGLDARFPQGSFTALVGYSGTGKTTLLQLLMRFYDPHQGSICLGGCDLRSITQDNLQAMFSPVFQQPYLFDSSLLANVRFGRPQASEDEIRQALEVSGCLTMAKQLPRGLETRLGENGRLLSGGQQQLVAIARCLLKDAPIVLFDEGVASLDPENAHLIMQAINRLSRNKTVIVIAHTLQRICQADKILVLDGGVICASGTHNELLKQGGIYARLWHRQQQASGWRLEKHPTV